MFTEYFERINRPGKNKLIEFMETSDFYSAPCSTKYHLNKPGGLAEHTLNVLKCALDLNARFNCGISEESIIIASIGHDFAKVWFYKESSEEMTPPQENYLKTLLRQKGLKMPPKVDKTFASKLIDCLKNNKEVPEYSPGYEVDDKLPLGHGERSLYLLSKCIDLTDEEALAVRWHMGSFEVGVHFGYPTGTAYQDAMKMSMLALILVIADMEASFILEAENEQPVSVL